MQLPYDTIAIRGPDDGEGRRLHCLLLHCGGEPRRAIAVNRGDAEIPLDHADGASPARERDTMERLGVRYLVPGRARIAERLGREAPVLLFVRGEPALDAPAVAIVGTRHPDAYGQDVARRLSGSLAGCGVTVVSGGAIGIDAAAHEGALDAGGRTVVVLGSGLAHPHPSSHRALFDRVVSSGSSLVSEYPMEARASRRRFPERNRLITAFSDAVVVVQAGRVSGAIITANRALSMKVPLFAVPGDIWYDLSAGTSSLLAAGARPLARAADLATVPGLEVTARAVWPPPGHRLHGLPPAWLGGDMPGKAGSDGCALAVQEALDGGPASFDSIVAGTGLPPGEVQAGLLDLELRGAVTRVDGGLFVRTS